MTVPKWLEQHLESRGLWDADGITRHARVRRCRKCRARIVVGLDADLVAGEAHCDPYPLSQLGEAAALILGRRTYSLRWIAALGELRIDGRGQFEIRGHPAGSTPRPGLPIYDVVAEHVCGTLPLPSIPSVHEKPRITFSDDPPY